MAMSQSIIMQGTYTADGTDKFLEVPLDANWIKLINLTQWDTAAGGADQLINSYWQEGMDYGIATRKNAADDNNPQSLFTK